MRTLLSLSLLSIVTAGSLTAQRAPAIPAPPRSAPIANVAYEVTFNRELAKRRSMSVTMTFDASGTTPGAAVAAGMDAWRIRDHQLREVGVELHPDSGGAGHCSGTSWTTTPGAFGRRARAGEGDLRVHGRHARQCDVLDARRVPRCSMAPTSSCIPKDSRSRFPATVKVSTETDWIVATGMTYGGARTAIARATTTTSWTCRSSSDASTSTACRWRGSPSASPRTRPAACRACHAPRPGPASRRCARRGAGVRRHAVRNYTIMQIADSSYEGASGLEHQNSHVDIISPLALGNPFLDVSMRTRSSTPGT